MANANISLGDLIPPPVEINNSHQVYSIAIACILLGVITAILVIIRLASRVWTRQFGFDDWVVILALLLFLGWTALAAYINLHAGVGKPMWEVTVEEWSLFRRGILISTFLYPPMSGTIRISTLLFFHRLFAHDKVTRVALLVLLAMQVGYIIAFTIVPGFLCNPVDKINDPFESFVYCSYPYFYATRTSVYVISMVFDLVLAIFPLVIVYKVQLPAAQRFTAAVIFLFGASATVPSVYKFAIHIKEGEPESFARNVGPEWFGYLMSRFVPPQFASWGHTFWIPCQLEPSIALIGMSIPAIRQLYFRLRGRNGTKTVSSRGQGSSGAHRAPKNTVESWSHLHSHGSDVELRENVVPPGKVYRTA